MDRLYNAILIGIATAAVLGFGLYGRSLQPLSGDLTRIGWYSENEFGWTLPQHRFAPLVATVGFAAPADIVAYGDSFTAEEPDTPGTTWPHFLARDTGRSVAIVDRGRLSIDALLESATWRDHPPAVLVYELIERSLIPEHGHGGTADCAARTATPETALEVAPLPVEPVAAARPRARSWDEFPAAYAINFAIQNLRRAIAGHETTNAVRLELARAGLFSSAADRSLLVYGTDFNKLGWTTAAWDAAACDLVRLQDRVQANGHTVFVAMIVPDKLTVYAPFLPYRKFDRASQLVRLDAVPALNRVRIGAILDPTAHVDLYLPDDTHWSPATQAMAAVEIRRTLQALGALVPRDAPGEPVISEE